MYINTKAKLSLLISLTLIVCLAQAAPDSDDDDGSSGDSSASSSEDTLQRITYAHALTMGISFGILFPLGATILRVFNFRQVAWFHGLWQLLTYVVVLAGFGMGVWIVNTEELWYAFNGHPIIGTVVVGVLLFQPIGGILHHVLYVKHQSATIYGLVHRWTGRIFLILGAINGGLGLQLADETRPRTIAYGVLSAFFFLLWGVTLLWHHRKRLSSH